MAVDRAHPEVWGPQLLQQLVARGAGGLDQDGTMLAGWLWPDFRPERLVAAGSSYNWDWILGACALYLDPSRTVFRGMDVSHWWLWLLERQVGLAVEGALDAPINCLGGTETLSVIYEPLRLGSVLAVRLAALRHPANALAPPVLDRTARYLRAVLSALALSAVPWTDPGYKGRAGFWYNGWTLSPVGERSEAPGLQTDLAPIYTLVVGLPPSAGPRPISKREGWAAKLLRRLLDEFPDDRGHLVPRSGAPPVPIADLQGVKLWAEQRWARFVEGGLTYKPRRRNHLSPAVFYSWADEAARRMTLGYPYPSGRHRGAHASQSDGRCAVEVDTSGVAIVAEIDGLTARQPLPRSRPSLYLVGDGQGFRRLQTWP